MVARQFVRNYLGSAIVGLLAAVLAVRWEPFKSSFTLAIMAGFAIGLVSALVELAARKLRRG